MSRLSVANRAQILGRIVEGSSMRATASMADVNFNTASKLLIDASAHLRAVGTRS